MPFVRGRVCAAALVLILSLAAAGAPAAFAQGQAEGIKEVTVGVEADPTEVAPGGTVTAKIRVEIAAGWHIYGLVKLKDGPEPTEITWKGDAALRPDGPVTAPPAKKKHDPGFDLDVEYYEGAVVFEQRFKVDAAAPAGARTIEGAFAFGACDANSCYPPATIPLHVPIKVLGAAVPETPPGPAPGLPDRPVVVKAAGDRAEARAGEWVELRLAVSITPGHHIYGFTAIPDGPIPTAIDLAPNPALTPLGAVEHPAPHKRLDPGFGFEVETFAGQVAFVQRLRVAAGTAAGPLVLKGKLHYMVCTEASCKPPADAPFEVTWQVAAGEPRAQFAGTPPAGGSPPPVAPPQAGPTAPAGPATRPPDGNPLNGSFLPFVLASLGAGVLTLLMPCTYPMVPMTISFFTHRAKSGQGNLVGLALVYALGIVGSFTGLGALITLVLGASGVAKFASNPWVNLAIGTLFVFFGLSLLGLYQIRLPGFVTSAAGRARMKSGYAGVLFMGLTFSVASFACVGPLAGALLALSATGEWFRPIVGMALLSSVCGGAFFLLALFPQFLSTLPQAGGWMARLEVALGAVELAAALKFLSNTDLVWGNYVLSRNLFLGLWVAIFAALALYLLGLVRIGHDAGERRVTAGRAVAALPAAALAAYLCLGFAPGRGMGFFEAFLPPPPSHEVEDFGLAVKEAREQGREILVDFSAYT